MALNPGLANFHGSWWFPSSPWMKIPSKLVEASIEGHSSVVQASMEVKFTSIETSPQVPWELDFLPWKLELFPWGVKDALKGVGGSFGNLPNAK